MYTAVCDVAKCVPMYLVSITMLNHTNVFVENYDVWNNKNVLVWYLVLLLNCKAEENKKKWTVKYFTLASSPFMLISSDLLLWIHIHILRLASNLTW